jgi:hypothetical protein
MQAAVVAVVNEIDRQAFRHGAPTANAVGTPGTLPSTQAAAYALLDEPKTRRWPR